jgi:SnoaL-like domain
MTAEPRARRSSQAEEAQPLDLARLVRSLSDRVDISELIDRYITAFDLLTDEPRDDEWYLSVFTEDIRLVFPVGGHTGIDGLAEFNRAARAKWARTHHLSANHLVTLDGDRATVRAHLLVTHVPDIDETGHHLSTGSHFDATAVRTPAGWRLREIVFTLVWISGQPPAG